MNRRQISPRGDADDEVECHRVAQQILRAFIVALSQSDGDGRGRTDANCCAKRTTKVHEGEGDGQASDGVRTNDLSDKDSVNDIIQ